MCGSMRNSPPPAGSCREEIWLPGQSSGYAWGLMPWTSALGSAARWVRFMGHNRLRVRRMPTGTTGRSANLARISWQSLPGGNFPSMFPRRFARGP